MSRWRTAIQKNKWKKVYGIIVIIIITRENEVTTDGIEEKKVEWCKVGESTKISAT